MKLFTSTAICWLSLSAAINFSAPRSMYILMAGELDDQRIGGDRPPVFC